MSTARKNNPVKNCHYVPRSITKPWEYKDRKLLLYDFKKKAFDEKPSKKALAAPKLNSQLVEDNLRDLIETPIGEFKTKIFNTSIHEISEWKFFRAFFLYFLTQAPRFLASRKSQNLATISVNNILNKTISDLDILVDQMMNEYDLVKYIMPTGSVLFFPENGYFKCPMPDTSAIEGYSDTFLLPLDPFRAVGIRFKTADDTFFKNYPYIFEPFSVGINENVTRILIPPILLELNNREVIMQTIESYRAGAKDMEKLVLKINQLKDEMLSIALQRFI